MTAGLAAKIQAADAKVQAAITAAEASLQSDPSKAYQLYGVAMDLLAAVREGLHPDVRVTNLQAAMDAAASTAQASGVAAL